jgi:integrase
LTKIEEKENIIINRSGRSTYPEQKSVSRSGATRNVVSAIRTAFKFGYKDLPGKFNPALALSTLRITKKDRPPLDPFSVSDAEAIISASHRLHGEWYGNYEEFRFFTGLRQSEQFALEVSDCDLANGAISITKAVVLSRGKNRTKTNQDREIKLCPRALEVLRSQLALRERMVAAGEVSHRCVFVTEGGDPFQTVYLPYNRWREVMETFAVRYRKPYNARHTYISWRLMKGDNPMLVAQEDGHSVETMLRTYAAWIKGAKSEDIERIKQAMAGRPAIDSVSEDFGARRPPDSPNLATNWPLAGQIAAIQASTPVTGALNTEHPTHSFNKGKCLTAKAKKLAGVEGFEPPNGGIKTRCLTTWRHPTINIPGCSSAKDSAAAARHSFRGLPCRAIAPGPS